MNWLHYLVEANIYLGVFYLCYCLFLNNETHYVLGRTYLLFSCVLSFILPLTQVSILKPVEPQVKQVEYIPRPAYTGPVPEITIEEPVHGVTANDVLFYAYIIGALVTTAILIHRLYRLFLLTKRSKAPYANKYKMVQLNGDNTAFSFFNYLFIGSNVPKPETIIAHELVHIRQKHSADIIFLEVLKVLCWFNPLIYLVQRSLRTIHEYIADEQTAAYEQDALSYSSFLLNNAYGIQGSPIAHSFFNYNLLKKRIIMLNQKRSGRLARLKYLAAVPLCAGMLCASTLVFSKDYGLIELAPAKVAPIEITIDKPATIKYLKVMDKVKDITGYSGNLSFTVNGVKKTYLATTITDTDIAYIKDIMGLTVEVIDVDAKTLLPVTKSDASAKSDTAFAVRPQPVHGSNFTLQENGYLINGKEPYITVDVIDEAGNKKQYNSSTATTDDRKMLSDKYDFTFKKEEMLAFYNAAHAAPKPGQHRMIPPPPPYFLKEPYKGLEAYLQSNVMLPKTKQNGAVIVNFNLSSAGKIENATVLKSSGKGYDAVVLKAIQSYNAAIKDEAGKKTIEVDFYLPDNVPTYLGNNELRMKPNFLGNIIFSRLLPPPPPPRTTKRPPPPPPAPPVIVPDKPAKIGVVTPKAKMIKIDPPTAAPAPAEITIDEPAAAPKEITIDEPIAAPKKAKKAIKSKSVKPVLAPATAKLSPANTRLSVDSFKLASLKLIAPVTVAKMQPAKLKLIKPLKTNTKLDLKLDGPVMDNVKPLQFQDVKNR